MAIRQLAQGVTVSATGATKDIIHDNTGSVPLRNLILKVENQDGAARVPIFWIRSNAAATIVDTDRIGIVGSVADNDTGVWTIAEIPAGSHLLGGVDAAGTVFASLEEHDP